MAFPNKLKHDAITTVAFEVRFHSEELEELIVGRLADWAQKRFKSATKTRTGAADIPLALRKSNPQFVNLSTLDISTLVTPTSSRLIRTGNSVLGYILQGDYCGWNDFEIELFEAIDALDAAVPLAKITRIGLRYTNAFRPDVHSITGLSDINFCMAVGGEPITGSASAVFEKKVSENHKVAYRLGTPDSWTQQTPAGTTVIADFDVYSVSELPAPNMDEVKTWVTQAHSFEKAAFASILPKEIVEKLRDDT